MVKLPGTLKHLLSGKFFVIWALGFFCLLVYMYIHYIQYSGKGH